MAIQDNTIKQVKNQDGLIYELDSKYFNGKESSEFVSIDELDNINDEINGLKESTQTIIVPVKINEETGDFFIDLSVEEIVEIYSKLSENLTIPVRLYMPDVVSVQISVTIPMDGVILLHFDATRYEEEFGDTAFFTLGEIFIQSDGIYEIHIKESTPVRSAFCGISIPVSLDLESENSSEGIDYDSAVIELSQDELALVYDVLSENQKLILQIIIAVIYFYIFMTNENEPLLWIHTLGLKINLVLNRLTFLVLRITSIFWI